MPRLLSRAWFVLLLAACGDDSGTGGGIPCGDRTCSSGQVCCVDCDGRGSCGAPGSACPGIACMMGGADAAAGTMCGGLTCDRGQVCCIDCDGRGSCGPPGSICTGVACLPDAGGAGVPCGDILCDPNQTCCGTCEDPFCGPPGSDCPTPADCQPCGRLDEACCTGSCTGSLMCCEGVPYPPEGLCDDVCDMRSDRTIKEGVTPVDPAQILERLAGVPISSWSYRADGTSVRHLGPMAQDFHAAFGLGRSDRTIDYVDASGVALAAIQGLREGVEELRRENQALRRELDELRGRLEACSAR